MIQARFVLFYVFLVNAPLNHIAFFNLDKAWLKMVVLNTNEVVNHVLLGHLLLLLLSSEMCLSVIK